MFGFLLYGVKAREQRQERWSRVGGYALAGVCGLICVAAIVVGIYAMANKPSSKPAEEVGGRAHRPVRQIERVASPA